MGHCDPAPFAALIRHFRGQRNSRSATLPSFLGGPPVARTTRLAEQIALEADAHADHRALLAELVVQVAGRVIDRQVAIADKGCDALIEVVADAAEDLPGQVSIWPAADVGISAG